MEKTMIFSGPGGPLPPIRPAGEGQLPTNQPASAGPGAVSGAIGEARRATRAETPAAIDPARQGAGSEALAQEESNERARLAAPLVEPARPSARMFTGDAPTEATPAGPPPTFDLSILEKTRAIASSPPPVVRTAPDAQASPGVLETETAEPGDMSRDATEDTPRPEAPSSQTPQPELSGRSSQATAPETTAPEPDPTPRGAPPRQEVPGQTN